MESRVTTKNLENMEVESMAHGSVGPTIPVVGAVMFLVSGILAARPWVPRLRPCRSCGLA